MKKLMSLSSSQLRSLADQLDGLTKLVNSGGNVNAIADNVLTVTRNKHHFDEYLDNEDLWLYWWGDGRQYVVRFFERPSK